MNDKLPDKHPAAGDFSNYLTGITHDWMKTLTLLAFLLVPLFIILDYFTTPREFFGTFVAYRLIVVAIAVIQHLVVRFTRPGRGTLMHGYIISLAISLMIVMMTVQLGGFDSSYYAGLNLIIIAINLLLPWHPAHSAANSVITVGLYVAANSVLGGDFKGGNLINNLYFMLSTVVITISISYLRYTLTRREYSLRMDLSRAQVDEIRELARISQLVAAGDLSVRIEKKSADTAGMLETSFDMMIRDLRNALFQIKEMSDYVLAYSANIKKSTDSMADGAREQLSQTTRSAGMIKDMTETIITNSENALITDKLAGRSIRTASESGAVVDRAVEGIKRIADMVKDTAGKVQSLGRSGERINEVAQVIGDIAKQTNLLALNAAIEAAHHGEEGKGFAVVADEVGKLSDRTTQATTEITAMIQAVLRDIGTAVSSMDTARNEVDTAIGIVLEMHQSMKEIIELSENLREMVSQIASASGEQSHAAENIQNNILSINDIALDLAESVGEIVKTVGSMNSLSENLEKMVNRFKLN